MLTPPRSLACYLRRECDGIKKSCSGLIYAWIPRQTYSVTDGVMGPFGHSTVILLGLNEQ